MNALRDTALAFLILSVVFGLLERAFPAQVGQKPSLLRTAGVTDFCYFLGQYLLWPALVLPILATVQDLLQVGLSSSVHHWVHRVPLWLQAVLAVLLGDLTIYLGHRLQHHVEFLWRFHAVHHSAETLDWLAAHREHPLDGLYTQTLVNLPAFLLGFPLDVLSGLAAFRGMWAIYVHSNVRLDTGPLRILLGAPELHHWHHAKDRFHGNYANVSPLFDWIFGTYSYPDKEPDAIGLHEPFPKTYLGQLLYPFLPTRTRATPQH